MKAIIKLALLALVAFPNFLAAQDPPENPKFSLKLSELKPEGYSGKDIWITIVMTNISDQVLDCSSFIETNTLNHSFRYEVRDHEGKILEKAVQSSHPEMGISGGNYPCSLEPGERKKWDIAINKIYNLDQEGDYTIQVSRLAETKPDRGYVNSNILTIFVQPKADPSQK